jgi:hypothetical protein
MFEPRNKKLTINHKKLRDFQREHGPTDTLILDLYHLKLQDNFLFL